MIRRSTAAKEVRVELEKTAGLSIIGVWDLGEDRHEHRKTFDLPAIFGHTLALSPAARQLMKRPCDCAREYIREVLEQRGIIR